MSWNDTNAMAAAACGIAPRRGWPSVEVVSARPVPKPAVVCPEQQDCIDVANAAIRLLEHFRGDIERGSMVAARHSLRNAAEMVARLHTDWLETFRTLTGVKPEFCGHCGEPVECCECDSDVPFGAGI